VIFLFDLIAFLVVLIVPGYLVADRYFQGLEKAVLSVFLSLAVTSFLFYAVVSFFGISKEFIYGYALLLLVLFYFIKKPNFRGIMNYINSFELFRTKIKAENFPNLILIFLIVFSLSLTAFFIPWNTLIAYDDSSYHLPIINDIAEDGKKTFFAETHNIYQVRSNQFPLLFETFAGVTKFFVGNLFLFVSFISLILSLFLIFFISRQAGFTGIFSLLIFGLAPGVLVFSRYSYVDIFLSMFFLGVVFFILKYVKEENLFFLGIAGFLSGLLFLTKFTGVIFFVGFTLFLIYKKKIKTSGLFLLIFLFVLSAFFVSHLNAPAERIGVGGYGAIIENPFFQIPLSIIKLTDVLFTVFVQQYYLFWAPLFFFIGLLWRKQKENNFFSLLLISLIVFLSATLLTTSSPTLTGFPRYFLPFYALLSVFAGFQLEKIISLKNKKISIFFITLFISISIITSFFVLNNFIIQLDSVESYITQQIDNNSETSVWFINGAALQYKLNKVTAYDYAWKTDFSGEPCDFLKKHKINYIVYFHIDKLPDLGDFGIQLKESLDKNECSEVISVSRGSLNSATYRIIHSK